MIADLYKTIKDSKTFMEEQVYKNKYKIAVPLSYSQMEFILQVCELAMLLYKQSRGGNINDLR